MPGPTKKELMAQLAALQANNPGQVQNYAPKGPLPTTRTFPAAKSGAQYTLTQTKAPTTTFRTRPQGQHMLGVWKYQAQQAQAKGKKLTASQMRLLQDQSIVAQPPLSDAQRIAQGLPTHAQAKAARKAKSPNSTKKGVFGPKSGAGVSHRAGVSRTAGAGTTDRRGNVIWRYTLPNGTVGTIQGGNNPSFTVNKIVKQAGLSNVPGVLAIKAQILKTIERA